MTDSAAIGDLNAMGVHRVGQSTHFTKYDCLHPTPDQSTAVTSSTHIQAKVKHEDQSKLKVKVWVQTQEEAELAQLRDARRRALEQRDAQMRQLDELKARILADR